MAEEGAVLQQLKQFLNENNVPGQNITPATSFKDDLNFDWMDRQELKIKSEETFNITIPDDELRNLKTVDQWVKYVAEHT
jgi:acyl carrier protein